jgi:hypothetical protein
MPQVGISLPVRIVIQNTYEIIATGKYTSNHETRAWFIGVMQPWQLSSPVVKTVSMDEWQSLLVKSYFMWKMMNSENPWWALSSDALK